LTRPVFVATRVVTWVECLRFLRQRPRVACLFSE
jgi:hypothetical protein